MRSFVEKRLLAGILMLTVGVFLLLRYYNIVPFEFPHYLFSWKTLLILIGIVFLITERNNSTGLILIAIGSVFLATDIFNLSVRDVVRLIIPVVLIIAGLFLLLRRETYSSRDLNIPDNANLNDYLNDVSIFGGGEKRIRTQNFKGGRLTAIFGGSEIDLRGSDMAPGVNAIDMLCLFGGVSLRIPDDWEVKNEVTAIFGGFSDKRLSMRRNPEIAQPTEKVLYLKGLVIFGGGEIK
jgi:predicted membrane protein